MWVAGYQTGEEVAIGKKAIYIAGGGLGLQAMNFDGTLRWTCPIGSTDQCCPAISQDEDGHEVIYLYGISYEDGVGMAGFFAVDENAPGANVDLYNPLPDYFFPKCLVNGIRWSCPTREIQSRAAIAADGSIFVTSLSGGTPSGFLYKFTPQLAVAWQFPLPKGSSDNGPAIGPDGTVYACSGDNYLYAVTSAGALKWKYKLGNLGRSPVVGNPSDGGAVYVSTINGTLSAINPTTGRKIWSVSLGKFSGVAAVDNSRQTVYCMGQNAFYAYGFNGTRKWQIPAAGFRAKPAIGGDGTVYTCWGGALRAISASGTVLWSRDIGTNTAPVIDLERTLYVPVGGYRGLAAIRDDATAQPSVYYIEPRPNPVAVGEGCRLVAAGVNAAVNPIAQVDFYLDNGDGQFDPAVDSLLGTATASTPESPYVWPLDVAAGTLPVGSHTVFAVATESDTGTKSNVVSRIVTQE